ncbi:Immunoglobulin E-set superfamily protein [Raphanus sativus]|uniref:Rho GDP-dissociation inhibitor 1 isoform X2 n=1 Tax=Raphanus sativus TaxID=3726 RepID=A0A6J0LB44_RAPSA|nr:rho GDP-dissociation inhibitor 1 isoform X2 [Raphanus sativus]KAJ4877360.1 Immunoglobulin E-set superfamily protein [Raphanus sativus]
MGLEDEKKGGEASGETSEKETGLSRKNSDSSLSPTEDDDEDEKKPQLGPMIALKEQLEKDKDDESLRRWKEQLIGVVDLEDVGETPDPVVKILDLTVRSPDREEMVLTIPDDGLPNPKGPWFTIKEGSKYTLVFNFRVTNNIVSGLRYNNTVWKTGVKVDSTKTMLGTFSPQAEPYQHVMPEEITPSGIFARGSYSARTKFIDDDSKCYLEINYTFDIRKNWQ